MTLSFGNWYFSRYSLDCSFFAAFIVNASLKGIQDRSFLAYGKCTRCFALWLYILQALCGISANYQNCLLASPLLLCNAPQICHKFIVFVVCSMHSPILKATIVPLDPKENVTCLLNVTCFSIDEDGCADLWYESFFDWISLETQSAFSLGANYPGSHLVFQVVQFCNIFEEMLSIFIDSFGNLIYWLAFCVYFWQGACSYPTFIVICFAAWLSQYYLIRVVIGLFYSWGSLIFLSF